MPEPDRLGHRPVAAFYGDDFTGSTDALVQYHRFGLRGLLLVRDPGAGVISAASRYDVVGVAGVARSLGPEALRAEVGPVLTAFARIRPRVVQYKMCSTADSSSRRGSLGAAIELGREVFGARPVPVLAAQPELGRYTAFGHHFAREDGVVHRLDRQPTMSRHPATPMTESDLRLHLGAQTALPIGSLDVTTYDLPADIAAARYAAVLENAPGAVVFDAVRREHQRQAAELMLGAADGPLYALGSGGLSYGVAAALCGLDAPLPAGAEPDRGSGPALVVSGSCSGQTARQIRHALDAGWTGVALDLAALHRDPGYPAALAEEVAAATARTERGVVVHTALGESGDWPDDGGLVTRLGRVFGTVVTTAVRQAGVRRVVVAGGDTSGRVVRELGVDAIEVESVLAAGVALCRVLAADSPVDGLRLVLKGGQVGRTSLFEDVRRGGTADPGDRPEEGPWRQRRDAGT